MLCLMQIHLLAACLTTDPCPTNTHDALAPDPCDWHSTGSAAHLGDELGDDPAAALCREHQRRLALAQAQLRKLQEQHVALRRELQAAQRRDRLAELCRRQVRQLTPPIPVTSHHGSTACPVAPCLPQEWKQGLIQ